jgi:hypothetical protein
VANCAQSPTIRHYDVKLILFGKRKEVHMTSRTAAIIVCGLISALPALANGPMPDDPATSGNTGKMNPQREKWTRHRIEHLKREHQRHENELHDIELNRTGTAAYRLLNGNDPFEVNEADRRHDAIMRQREINTIEFLALKKERGELTPAGERKLRALIRNVREGH